MRASLRIPSGSVLSPDDLGLTHEHKNRLAAVERIEAELRSSPIVLFMKGSPDFPQCGFSARVVNALRACAAAFTHVDVLEDPELRQTLKIYSNWPTIPQLYISGTLAGGCDIVMEMYRSGELSLAVKQAGAILTDSR
jgi:monothiol glutaredoxin